MKYGCESSCCLQFDYDIFMRSSRTVMFRNFCLTSLVWVKTNATKNSGAGSG
jgi:hypothetical protein